MKEMITITKVVARNFVVDFFSKWRNIFGMNLTGYEKMIDRGIKQVTDELKEKKVKLKWFRYEITELTNGAMAIMLYGEKE